MLPNKWDSSFTFLAFIGISTVLKCSQKDLLGVELVVLPREAHVCEDKKCLNVSTMGISFHCLGNEASGDDQLGSVVAEDQLLPLLGHLLGRPAHG